MIKIATSLKYILCFLTLFLIFSLSSCSERKYKILSNNKNSLDSITISEIIQIVKINDIDDDFEVVYKEEKSLEDNFQMLIDKKIDFIVSQNDISFDYNEIQTRKKKKFNNDDDIRVVTALFTEALFIIYPDSLEVTSLAELLENRKVSLGMGDRTSKEIMPVLLEHLNIDTSKITFVANDFSEKDIKKRPDVLCLLTPFDDPLLKELLKDSTLTLFNFDLEEVLVEESTMAGFTMRYTPAYPFIIPAQSFGTVPKKAIITAAVDAVLLTRKDVSKITVYELLKALHKNHNISPVFSNIDEYKNNSSTLYYYLHKGSLSFYNQNQPTFLERYGRTLASIFSALLAGVATLIRIRNKRRYNRVKRYYDRAIEVEKKLTDNWKDISYLEESLDEALKIKEEVYDLLIEGKLDTNIQFQSFQDMINDLINQISLARQSAIILTQQQKNNKI